MSLWMQAATEALEYGHYQRFRQDLIPIAPFAVPFCMIRELEFAERRCLDVDKDRLFPIRFHWLFEAMEQRNWGLAPGERSRYHPEELLELWERAMRDSEYKRECEEGGIRFDNAEKAACFAEGWVYIGDRFVDDFLELETSIGVEMLFPSAPPGQDRPAFEAIKRERNWKLPHRRT
jgi:hypothetical protein